MAQLQANNIQIEYDTFGHRSDEPLLLVMGLGAQMIHWRDEFCQELADAGHFVVRFDNRDAGLSEKFGHAGVPNIPELMLLQAAGQPVAVPYSLDDMAADAFGVMDALDLESAHICGASMGGMIVQAMALNDPNRVRSLTSIMSTTGNPEVPPATDEAMGALMSPVGTERDEVIERSVTIARIIGSPGFPEPEEELRTRSAQAFDRSFYPEGVARQMAAIMQQENRRPGLERLDLRALVIHGEDDPLVPIAGGEDTHKALRGSTLMRLKGMGHDLPQQLWHKIVDGISRLTGGRKKAG